MEFLNHNHYDVVVIGGGPAGSTLSTLLVRKGYQVLLLERETFPRFHVGESLLPATQPIWEKLGIAEPMQHLGNTFKYAGELRIGLDPNHSDYERSTVKFNNVPRNSLQDRPYAYQVERGQFDLFLLNHARQEKVVVEEGAVVKEVLWEGDKATGVRWRSASGAEYTTQAECVADCSGRHAFISRERKFLTPSPTIKTSAVFGHFKQVTRASGLQQGYIHTYLIENGWLWFIPLHSDVMSVGVVVNQPGTDWWSKKSPEEILLTYINRYKFLRDRFELAEQSSKVRMLRGLPYSSTRSVGDGWILVGDANFFVDPLFSSGVHVAFKSADKAADTIDDFLQSNRNMRSMAKYERWGRDYQFHLFTTIGILYKMLQYKIAVEGLVKITGRYTNHWNNPVLRRLVTWVAGDFDQSHLVLYVAWCFCLLGVQVGKWRENFLGIPGWGSPREFCLEPPLVISKSPESMERGEENGSSAVFTDLLHDLNYPEHWVVPSDETSDMASAKMHKPELQPF